MNYMGEITAMNVGEALERKKYKQVYDYSEKNSADLLKTWSEGNKQLVKRNIIASETAMRRISNWIERIKDVRIRTAFALGFWQGSLASLRHVLYCEAKTDESLTFQKRFQYISHMEDVVKAIYDEGSLSHTELAERLGLSPSTLSTAMKKILMEEIIYSTSSGKYRVYSLTNQGRQYAKLLNKMANEKEQKRSNMINDEDDVQKRKYGAINGQIKRIFNVENAIYPGDMINVFTNEGKNWERFKINSITFDPVYKEKDVEAEKWLDDSIKNYNLPA